MIFGYSLSFAPAYPNNHTNELFGDGSRLWLRGMTLRTFHYLAPTIPESVYCTFQLTFAIITAALICGSFADRMKYTSMIIFVTIWHLVVYCPMAHSNWHYQGKSQSNSQSNSHTTLMLINSHTDPTLTPIQIPSPIRATKVF